MKKAEELAQKEKRLKEWEIRLQYREEEGDQLYVKIANDRVALNTDIAGRTGRCEKASLALTIKEDKYLMSKEKLAADTKTFNKAKANWQSKETSIKDHLEEIRLLEVAVRDKNDIADASIEKNKETSKANKAKKVELKRIQENLEADEKDITVRIKDIEKEEAVLEKKLTILVKAELKVEKEWKVIEEAKAVNVSDAESNRAAAGLLEERTKIAEAEERQAKIKIGELQKIRG